MKNIPMQNMISNRLLPKNILAQALGLALLGLTAQAFADDQTTPAATPQQQPAAPAQSAAAPAPAQAQTAAPAADGQIKELDHVSVTGFRHSLEYSTDAKRDSTGFTDSIFSEDIGKFPDTNIAESLQRIPGIQLNRDVDGTGLNVAVRGLPNSFTKVTVNGNSVATASIGLDATNQDREVDLNMFPTEFFNQLTVHKSSQADLIEGGAAGNIDMRNQRPFDNPGTHLTYNLQGSQNSNSHKDVPQGSLIGSWTNSSGTFGALLGVSLQHSKISVNSWEDGNGGWTDPGLTAAQCDDAATCGSGAQGNHRWRIPDTVPNNPATIGAGLTPGDVIDQQWLMAHNPGLTAAQIGTALVPYLPRPVSMTEDKKRDSFLGSLEWRPSDNAHFWVDYLYSREHNTNDRIDMDLVARNNNANGMIPLNMQVDPNGVVTSATLTNAQFFLEARPYVETAQYWQVDPGATFYFDDQNIRLDVQTGTSRSWLRRQTPTILVNSPFTTVQYTNTNGIPTISTLDGLNLDDPNAGWFLQDPTGNGRVNVQNEHRLTKTSDARADLQFGGDDKNNVKVGVAFDSDYRRIQGFDNSAAWQSEVFSDIPNSELASYLMPGPDGFITADFAKFMKDTNYQYYSDTAPETGSTNNVAQTGSFDEDNRAAYIEFNEASDVWDRELRINAGVRYAGTSQYISGPVTLNGVRQWQTTAHDYNEWLPSFSAAWDVAKDVVLRMSGSKTMTRPNPSAMLPATTFGGIGADAATQGNPNLAPYLSTNFDFGGEWYTGEEGYVGATFFNKRIQGYTYTGVSEETLSQMGVPYSALTPLQQEQVDANGGYNNFKVDVTEQINADAELNVRGWELDWVQPLSFLTNGLGFMANYTKMNLTTSGNDAAALAGNVYGISPKMWNSTLYWENYGFSVRLSYNWTKGAQGSASNQNNIQWASYYGADRGQTDLSASYTIKSLPSHPQITLDVLNLNNQPIISYFGDEKMVDKYYLGGRTVTLGIRGTF